MTDREVFVILGHFSTFDTPNNPKSKFEKMKKNLEILSFYTCVPLMKIIWQMVPEIWSTTDRYFYQFGHFCVILCHFLAFYHTNKPQNQNFQKEKKNDLEMSTFYTCLPKIMIIWCMLPEIWSTTDTFFCHFGPFFAHLPH